MSFSNPSQYSLNGTDWNELQADEQTHVINTGEKIYFKANGLTPDDQNGIGQFTVSKSFNLSGNIMSMLFGDEAEDKTDLTGYDYAFLGLFFRTPVINISSDFLPATTLSNDCYTSMFYGCTSLITAPKLPATTLTDNCYSNMFRNCVSLITAPTLPATELASRCYSHMFYDTNVLPDCTNIDFRRESVVSSKALVGLFAGTKVTDKDLYNILPINPSTGKYWLPVTTLTEGCYSDMFNGCTSFTTAPDLPATTLAN